MRPSERKYGRLVESTLVLCNAVYWMDGMGRTEESDEGETNFSECWVSVLHVMLQNRCSSVLHWARPLSHALAVA